MRRAKYVFKSVLCLILITSLVLCSASLICYGEGTLEAEIENYVISCLGGYLGGIGITTEDSIFMTQGFKVENTPKEEQQRTFFIFKDDFVVGH